MKARVTAGWIEQWPEPSEEATEADEEAEA
jgi:hypothetical protein